MKLAVDLIIDRQGEVLFVRRKYPPFEGMLALPGGFVEEDETVEAAAIRELREETGVTVELSDLALVGVYSALGRDPRGRVVSVAFQCFVPPTTTAVAGDDAAAAEWHPRYWAFDVGLAFDHARILADEERRIIR